MTNNFDWEIIITMIIIISFFFADFDMVVYLIQLSEDLFVLFIRVH